MQKHKKRRTSFLIVISLLIILTVCIASLLFFTLYWYTHIFYKNRIYPVVSIDNVPFGGKTIDDVKEYWKIRNKSFDNITITFAFENTTATLSSTMLDLGYDATLSGTQAYLIGRSPYPWSNIDQLFFKKNINLPPVFRWDDGVVTELIASLSATIDILPDDALFSFANGKVNAFKPSKSGRAVDQKELHRLFEESIPYIMNGKLTHIIIPIPVQTIEPKIKTNQANTFGIKELIAKGYSEFHGSIPGRIHNVALAASKLNGILIKPGEIFSFNDTVGDISAATGYQSAYIIKDGRTVLGDGGGVCQVSTTLFRAALNAGLPILERHEHSYRVHYYEDGGFKAGIDATVYSPSNDLKIKNDTPAFILIQTKTDVDNLSLTFELYGTSDGRKAEITNHFVTGETPPPPPLYQDDPTLPKGVVKQVDFAAWGAKASFQYKVTRGTMLLIDQTFVSNYRPWQAVYLKGTKE